MAVQGLGEFPGGAAFADAFGAVEQVGMGDAAVVEGALNYFFSLLVAQDGAKRHDS